MIFSFAAIVCQLQILVVRPLITNNMHDIHPKKLYWSVHSHQQKSPEDILKVQIVLPAGQSLLSTRGIQVGII